MRRLLLPCWMILALAAPAAAAVPIQDPSQMGRLAADQRLVAEQVRRLTRLLETLEQRDRAEDRAARADLLAQAAARLKGVETGGELAAVIEAIAGDLAALRTGAALDAQQSAIRTLEDLLALLLETQTSVEEQQRRTSLEEFLKQMQELLRRQEELRRRNEDLLPKKAEAGANASASQSAESPASGVTGAAREMSASERALREELARLAEEQHRLAEEIAKSGRNNRSQEASGAAEHAAHAAEQLDAAAQQGESQQGESQQGESQQGESQQGESQQGESQQGESQQGESQQGESQQSAAEQQRATEEALKQAIRQAKQDLQQLENRKRLQDLEDVLLLAEQILAAHRAEEDTLRELAAAGVDRLTRAQRARLRQSARTEEDLAASTQSLLVKIETLGASTFPFFLKSLQEDHRRLAQEVGPPRLELDEHALLLAADLRLNWESLIEVIRIEQERIRRKMEQPEEGPGSGSANPNQALVDFAMELQLLKRLQQSLAGDLAWSRRRHERYAQAGIVTGPEDELELRGLLDRQLELRRQFEGMLARYQGLNPDVVGGGNL